MTLVMMEKHVMLQITVSIVVALILGLFFTLYSVVVATPRRLRRLLKQQGFGGPPPSLFLGNIMEIKKLTQNSTTVTTTAAAAEAAPLSHNFQDLFAVFWKWRRQYGDIYTFSLGTSPVLVVNDYDVIKEINKCQSLDLGRPLYLVKDFKSLLGNGVSSANGEFWAYQRKVVAPALFTDKVKGMTNSIQLSSQMLIDSWKGEIDNQGGKADIKIDSYMKKFAGDAISRVCFGSNYDEGEQLFQNLGDLHDATAKKGFFLSIPGMRFLPTKQKRREWEIERDVRELILKLVKDKNESDDGDRNIYMLKVIVEGAQNTNLSTGAKEDFIVNNCKSILLAGYEPTSASATWCLMLLASNQEWQDRVREEVIGVCKGQLPDSDTIKQMKQLTMVILESLRLYTTAHISSRCALNDLEFANVRVPKGVIIWIMVSAMHTDPNIWGPDSYEFKPERFANGISGASKLPHLFMPFGVGSRRCVGQNLAMVEIKILVAHILANFSFSLSPKYVHAPTISVHLKPGNGVDLVIENLKKLPSIVASS